MVARRQTGAPVRRRMRVVDAAIGADAVLRMVAVLLFGASVWPAEVFGADDPVVAEVSGRIVDGLMRPLEGCYIRAFEEVPFSSAWTSGAYFATFSDSNGTYRGILRDCVFPVRICVTNDGYTTADALLQFQHPRLRHDVVLRKRAVITTNDIDRLLSLTGGEVRAALDELLTSEWVSKPEELSRMVFMDGERLREPLRGLATNTDAYVKIKALDLLETINDPRDLDIFRESPGLIIPESPVVGHDALDVVSRAGESLVEAGDEGVSRKREWGLVNNAGRIMLASWYLSSPRQGSRSYFLVFVKDGDMWRFSHYWVRWL